ncbi:hypothetical protein IBTHAUMO2_790004 [Nitrosopumilaceae archaeon]|nr:hypothetical protein IBTHAUMO2_790004 [Nitrosopumilaceae archaeon]
MALACRDEGPSLHPDHAELRRARGRTLRSRG